MKRLYEEVLLDHLINNRQMAFLSGPRQVGKTTTVKAVGVDRDYSYLNWDVPEDNRLIAKGVEGVAEAGGLLELRQDKPLLIFDEIHKYGRWKLFLKGFFDTHGERCHTIVTGSGRLDVYKQGGDSLMGRYFLYRMHPLSVAELAATSLRDHEIGLPCKVDADQIDGLFKFGGFPEPFLAGDTRFYNRWRRLRTEQLLMEDLRDLTRVQEVSQIRILAELIQYLAGQTVNYSNLAKQVTASVDTIRRWISTLESLHYCFTIQPWHTNVPRALRKQPKVFLWDWSLIQDKGARHENFIASHLLKAVHWWTDFGLGTYALHFLRDKDKREVDFLVTRNAKPWFLVEVKSSGSRAISKNLSYFQEKTGAKHAFQLAFDLDFVEQDCFSVQTPVRVPATTFLSQLV